METTDNFNRIIEMNTEAERRKIAAMAMQGILSDEVSQRVAMDISEVSQYPEGIAKYAVACADALIAELNKNKNGK